MKNYARMTEEQLHEQLKMLRSVVAAKGTFICVYERGQCERILAELDKRKKK